MALQIVAPSERISGIIADLSRRRALINDVLPKGDRNKVNGWGSAYVLKAII